MLSYVGVWTVTRDYQPGVVRQSSGMVRTGGGVAGGGAGAAGTSHQLEQYWLRYPVPSDGPLFCSLGSLWVGCTVPALL